jgi:hypothetical protein
MLYNFKKGNNATVATKNICKVYGEVLDVRKCQRWFARFCSQDLSLKDSTGSGRHIEINIEAFKTLV